MVPTESGEVVMGVCLVDAKGAARFLEEAAERPLYLRLLGSVGQSMTGIKGLGMRLWENQRKGI